MIFCKFLHCYCMWNPLKYNHTKLILNKFIILGGSWHKNSYQSTFRSAATQYMALGPFDVIIVIISSLYICTTVTKNLRRVTIATQFCSSLWQQCCLWLIRLLMLLDLQFCLEITNCWLVFSSATFRQKAFLI